MARIKMTDGNRRKVRGQQKPSPTAAGKVGPSRRAARQFGKKGNRGPLGAVPRLDSPAGRREARTQLGTAFRQAGMRNNVKKSLSWGVGEQKTRLSTQQILPSNRKE